MVDSRRFKIMSISPKGTDPPSNSARLLTMPSSGTGTSHSRQSSAKRALLSNLNIISNPSQQNSTDGNFDASRSLATPMNNASLMVDIRTTRSTFCLVVQFEHHL